MRTASVFVFVAASAVLGGVGACTATNVSPPNGSATEKEEDRIKLFFPTGTALSPNGSRLFVANANSDLTYDSGAIHVIDLTVVDDVVARWLMNKDPGACGPDADFTETLVCDETVLLEGTREDGVRIGNFATEIAVQDTGNGNARLIVPTRGDPSIAWVDWDGTRLSCNANEKKFESCDDTHRLASLFSDANQAAIPEEPFGVFADSAGEFAVVTHLTTGAVTLIDSPKLGEAKVTDVVTGVFASDPSTGLRGATGVVGRTPNAPGDIVYVGSRSENRVQMFTVGRAVPGADQSPFLLSGNWFFSGASDTRGMAFSPTGERLYLVGRRPPVLQIWDTSIGGTGFPRNALSGVVDICRQASTIAVADPGDGERAYVTCFQDGQIYVVDPRGRGQIEDIINIGRGPYSVAVSTGHKKLYVTNFLEDTIAVVDLDPRSKTYNRVVLRIGVPRSS